MLKYTEIVEKTSPDLLLVNLLPADRGLLCQLWTRLQTSNLQKFTLGWKLWREKMYMRTIVEKIRKIFVKPGSQELVWLPPKLYSPLQAFLLPPFSDSPIWKLKFTVFMFSSWFQFLMLFICSRWPTSLLRAAAAASPFSSSNFLFISAISLQWYNIRM